VPIYREATALLGAEHAACAALRRGFEWLARGCHRYQHAEKSAAYREARDAFSQAACELALADREAAAKLLEPLEQELMAAIVGLLRRTEGRERR
jgi:hypothetical protein